MSLREGRLIYEGKAKRVYLISNDELIMEFKDEVTALDGARKEHAPGKGKLTASQTAFFMDYLTKSGIRTHFINWDGDRRIHVRRLRMIPVEVIVRNYAYGSFVRRMPLMKPLTRFTAPLVEFHLKNDEFHDPLILLEDIIEAELASMEQIMEVKSVALKVNQLLSELLSKHGLILVDFKLEFGINGNGALVLADELSGDTMRILMNGKHLDKELFRMGGSVKELVEAYSTLNSILGLSL